MTARIATSMLLGFVQPWASSVAAAVRGQTTSALSGGRSPE